MSSNSSLNVSETENACVVCFKNVEVHSVGICEHPVCFECSTRMRVVCNQCECPICRQEMPKVIFTEEVQPFKELLSKVEPLNFLDRKYGILFATSLIQKRYHALLAHECYLCKRHPSNIPFKAFQQLKDHMRRAHELFYCELCFTNLKIFTFERRWYTRTELATHRRKGDIDNKSHKGHPLCQFCDTRFMDNDELYRHLRRDHLFCHFCDADGKHQYYSSYDDLRTHYLDEHYLCEEGSCKLNLLTAVFRTDIDLKAHYAVAHGKNMSKSANRQARTLEIQFTLAPRPVNRGMMRYGGRHSQRDDERPAEASTYSVEPGGDNRPVFQNALVAEDFPSLGGEPSSSSRTVSNVTITSKINPLSDENFPSLGGSSSNRQPAVTITRTVRGQQGLQRNSSNFPALGESSGTSGSLRFSVNNQPEYSKASNVSIQVNHKPNGAVTTRISQTPNGQIVSVRPKTAEYFPALSSEPVPPVQWLPQKPKKQEPPKPEKVQPRASSSVPNSLKEFPTLSKKTNSEPRKSSSVTMPMSNVWVNLNSFNSDNKNSSSNETKSKPKPQPMKPPEEPKTKNKKKKPKNELSNKLSRLEVSTEPPPVTNGITKKRSELNIEALEVSENVKPPPGFNLKPPPGFTNFILPNNDLTFTNSSGQSYSITPGQQYYSPPNFKLRNQMLIEKFKKLLLDGEVIQQFKLFSDMFRLGEITSEKYYEHCREIMGKEFAQIFPELLVLLPDIQKQQDLYKIHKGSNGTKGLEICATCKQIVLASDLRNHLTNHTLDNHFPVLGHTSDINNVWNKK